MLPFMPRTRKNKPLQDVIISSLEDSKAQDIKNLDVRKLTTITDNMIICTGTSTRHVKSIANNLVEKSKKAGFNLWGIEGEEHGEWILVDLGDAVIHVMLAKTREFYSLEKLWGINLTRKRRVS